MEKVNEALTLLSQSLELLKMVDSLTQSRLDDAIALIEQSVEKLSNCTL